MCLTCDMTPRNRSASFTMSAAIPISACRSWNATPSDLRQASRCGPWDWGLGKNDTATPKTDPTSDLRQAGRCGRESKRENHLGRESQSSPKTNPPSRRTCLHRLPSAPRGGRCRPHRWRWWRQAGPEPGFAAAAEAAVGAVHMRHWGTAPHRVRQRVAAAGTAEGRRECTAAGRTVPHREAVQVGNFQVRRSTARCTAAGAVVGVRSSHNTPGLLPLDRKVHL